MSGKEWLLKQLEDGQWHSGDALRMLSHTQRGRAISLHPRVTDLREEGYVIENQKVGHDYHFRLVEKGEPVPKAPPIVQGFKFDSADDPRNGNICRIISRSEASDHEILENGPAFLVRFGDGSTDVVFSSELSPWYPT